MTDLDALKRELERLGDTNDAAATERPRRFLNITRDTGEFLGVLVRAAGARWILEIGTSNGYSTLWLAEAALATGGRVTTVERAEYKVGLARENFERSGLAGVIDVVHDDAGSAMERTPSQSVDLLFLDSEREDYVRWWPDIRRILRDGGVLVVDNAVSHAREVESFVALVRADAAFTTCLVPVGKGEFVAVKSRASGDQAAR